MFGLANVNNPLYDESKNWYAGTGEGGNQVGYICGPRVATGTCGACGGGGSGGGSDNATDIKISVFLLLYFVFM